MEREAWAVTVRWAERGRPVATGAFRALRAGVTRFLAYSRFAGGFVSGKG